MRCCTALFLIATMLGAHGAEKGVPTLGRSPSIPLPGPGLEAIPLLTVDRAQLPAPATWPTLRRTHRLRILMLKDHGNAESASFSIGQCLGTRVEVRYFTPMLGQSADFLLTEDASGKAPSEKDLKAYCQQISREAIAIRDGKLPADVIFLMDANPFNDEATQKLLLDYVNAGGVLVVCGNLYPKTNHLFADAWPAVPRKNPNGEAMNSWHDGGATRAYGPELSGLPLRLLSSWMWIPLADVTSGSTGLATGETGACFLRKVGKGTLLFVPTGPLSHTWNAVARVEGPFGHDYDEIWLRFWDQLLNEVVDGPKAFPAYTDLRHKSDPAKKIEVGAVCELAAHFENRAWQSPLTFSIHVTDRNGKVVFTRTESLKLAVGKKQDVPVSIPVETTWPSGKYAVTLTLADPTAKKQIHQSLEYFDVAGPLQLELKADKFFYRYGETAQLTLAASGRKPWKGKVAFGVYDYRGRLLSTAAQDVSFDESNRTVPFTYRMVDHGVKVDNFRASASALSEGREVGHAECKFGLGERWSERNEYQWSSWGNSAQFSLLVPTLRLNAFAGFNALGFTPGAEMTWPAERYGWRVYNEGIGVATFSPVIEYENDQEMESVYRQQAMKTAKDAAQGFLRSPSLAFGSIGEEAGFGHGWGGKFYWKTPVAPEKACRAFQWYLKTRYETLDALNAAWRTDYASWNEVQLTKRLSGDVPKPLLSGGAVDPTDLPEKAIDNKGSFVPYRDTYEFYRWYYDKIVATAVRVFHEEINPRPRTTVSTGFDLFMSPEVDTISTPVASQYNEMQWDGQTEEPGFGLCALFPYDDDWGAKRSILGHTHAGSTHITAYMGDNAHFNQDLTLGRGAMVLRRWMALLDGRTRILLDRTLPHNGVGVLSSRSRMVPAPAGDMVKTVTVALQQAGYGYRDVKGDNIDGCQIILAPQAFVASDALGRKLAAHVQNGGVLVIFPGFFSETDKAVPTSPMPGAQLSAAWGLKVTTANYATDWYAGKKIEAGLEGISPALKDARLTSLEGYRDRIEAPAWTVRAAYPDGFPAVLSRPIGQGTVYYVNAFYASHHYIQTVTPTDAARQGFFKLIEWLCEQTKAVRTYRINGDLRETLLPAHTQFTDPTGKINYVVMTTSWGIPWVHGTLTPLGPARVGYDVLARAPGQPSPRLGDTVPFQMMPAGLRLFAFLERPIKTVRVEATPARIAAGQPFTLTVHILGDDGRPIPGQFPLDIRVIEADGKVIPALQRTVSLVSGGTLTLNTALNDPAGTCQVIVTESISGLVGQAPLQIVFGETASAPAFRPLGWLSDQEAPIPLSPDEFLSCLRELTALYLKDYSGLETWKARLQLSYYTEFMPHGRHDLAVRLSDVNWLNYRNALKKALAAGETFILTGEDVNVDPATGLSTYPHLDGHQLAALTDMLQGAHWYRGTADGDTLVAIAGKGRVVLCRESLDALGTYGGSMRRWQTRWKYELDKTGALTKAALDNRISAPDAAGLFAWWSGRTSIGDACKSSPLRTITLLGNNEQELTVKIDPAKDTLGSVFLLKLPPTGTVTSAKLSIAATGEIPMTVDVGADGEVEDQLAKDSASTDWTQAINNYLTWREQSGAGPARDDNNWRIIPIRLSTAKPATVMVKDVIIQVR